MLKTLFSSNTRIKVLSKFLLSPLGSEFYGRELTRDLADRNSKAIPVNAINYELNKLKEIGFFKTRTEKSKIYFRLNPDFLFLDELRSIFQKGTLEIGKIAKKIQRMGKIKLLIFSGFFIGQESETDIFLVGEVDKKKLSDYISRELDFAQEIKYTIFSENAFFQRLEHNDKFTKNFLSNSKNMVLVDKVSQKFDE